MRNAEAMADCKTGCMLEMLTLAGHLVMPAQLEWSTRKHMLRARLVEVIQVTNEGHDRHDRRPRMTLARMHGRHGVYDHARERMVLDLESVNDARKFWHVYHETIPHEWSHALNERINDKRGHGTEFHTLLQSIRSEAYLH